MDFGDQIWRYKSSRNPRTLVSGSAGLIAFFAGVMLAGKIMVWFGFFERGKTPPMETLDYWPGFLAGGLLLGFLAVFAARKLYDLVHEAE